VLQVCLRFLCSIRRSVPLLLLLLAMAILLYRDSAVSQSADHSRDIGRIIIIVGSILCAIDVIVVVLRFLSRFKTRIPITADDLLIIPALVRSSGS